MKHPETRIAAAAKNAANAPVSGVQVVNAGVFAFYQNLFADIASSVLGGDHRVAFSHSDAVELLEMTVSPDVSLARHSIPLASLGSHASVAPTMPAGSSLLADLQRKLVDRFVLAALAASLSGWNRLAEKICHAVLLYAEADPANPRDEQQTERKPERLSWFMRPALSACSL